MRLTDIYKPTAHEEEFFLSAMIDMIMLYHERLNELEERYQRIACNLISPCYFNFRDALFHYEKAYNSQEIIQLYCEQNAMQEHLHRALKDGCIEYLQLINERLDILYRYSCTEERFRDLSEQAELISSKAGMTLEEVHSYGQNIIKLVDQLPKSISTRDYQLLCEYLYNIRFGRPCNLRKCLQKLFHELRNLELDSRNSSMLIIKPFATDVDKSSGKAPIDHFFEKCDKCLSMIKAEGFEDYIIAAKILKSPVAI